MSRRGVAVAAALALAGCATVDKETLQRQMPEAPPAWAASADVSGAPAEDWVAAFNDKRLNALVAEAMEHNNSLLQAAASLDAARAQARIVLATLLPTVNASPRASRSAIVTDPGAAAQVGTGGPAQSRRIYVNNYSLGAQATWEIDLWGRLRDNTRASWRDAAAVEAEYRGRRLSIAGAVAQSWFQLIQARQQRELSERDVAARQRNLSVIERRYESGVATSLDVRLARSALGSSQAQLALNQRVEGESARQLEVLLGRYPKAEIEAAASLPDLHPLAGAGAPGELLARRPDVLAAEARMQSAGLRARAARKEFLPRLTLSSSISTSGPDVSDLTDPKRLAGNIAAGLFQPLFQGGQLLANSRRARANAEAALYNYVQTALVAWQDAEDAIAAERLLAERETALRLAYEEAAAAEDITERRYLGGAASIFDLLNAQTRRIANEQGYILAKQQRLANRVQLYLAIGGDFSAAAPAEPEAGAAR